MGFKLSSSLGSLAGGAIGAFFGGPSGAVSGAQIGNALLGSNDDEMTALEAYQMQRADALADWNRQNEYNSPEAIMQRYVKAGINPYLAVNAATGSSSSPIDNVTYSGSYAQPTSKRLQNILQNLNLRSMQADTKGKEVDTEMRELDLALKKARLAKLGSGGSITNPLKIRKDELDIEKKERELENPRRSLTDLNTYRDVGSDVVEWLTDKILGFGQYMKNYNDQYYNPPVPRELWK